MKTPGATMGKRFTATVAATLLALLALAGTPRPAPLTAKQQKVLDYLVANWGKDTAVTGIDLGMQILGGDYTPEDRYALATYIRDHPEIHRVIRVFGWMAVALTPEEKLIARQLSRAEREKRPAPTSVELARSVEVGPKAISGALQMLERLGIIRPDPGAGGVGYRMANERYVTWEGMMKIDFMYHRVQIEGQQPLDTY
jgi:hypothetical protein